jgi:DNA-binding HxlR family transcriptional regulator
MTLKLQLVRDNKVIYEMPLEMSIWTRRRIEEELELVEGQIERVSAIHEMLSSGTRIRMLNRIIQNMDVRFSDLMNQLDANQKIVNENLQRLRSRRMISRHETNPREVHYTASRLGVASLLMMTALHRVMDELKEE